LDTFVIMTNHVYGIIDIVDTVSTITVGAGSEPAPTVMVDPIHGLPEIIRQLKTFSEKFFWQTGNSSFCQASKWWVITELNH
jgi:hypothetical protein